jgi:ribose 5-phosphate isomerase B
VKVAVAFDHRGVHLREAVLEALERHDVVDFGTHTDEVRIDYPDKAREVGEAIQHGAAQRAVLVCGSGDDMNVLCLGSEVVGPSLARELVDAFLNATFNGGERYVARLLKVAEMERTMKSGEVTPA